MHSKRNTLKIFFAASISSRQETLFEKHGDADIYTHTKHIYRARDSYILPKFDFKTFHSKLESVML